MNIVHEMVGEVKGDVAEPVQEAVKVVGPVNPPPAPVLAVGGGGGTGQGRLGGSVLAAAAVGAVLSQAGPPAPAQEGRVVQHKGQIVVGDP